MSRSRAPAFSDRQVVIFLEAVGNIPLEIFRKNQKPKNLKPFNYIKYLFKATNQHGVHSPFIYSYLVNGLYKRKSFPENSLLSAWKKHNNFSKRKQKILNRTFSYFNDENFIKAHDNLFREDKTVYFSLKENSPEEILKQSNSFNLLVVDAIIEDAEKQKAWLFLKEHKGFNISIDLYDIGFLFRRNEQVKEDFRIRI
ncbi:hypothetical protein HX109_02245 [Galbibacter sp. BG1]|uniref:hypothetical protein n=1 Tax=Galbibacter sp. BG1 TaxID=1170699 RepID=UPI0015C07F5C|nr:hypothetical protein [Galbibacter sp. BG1]QLE00435.1 hypothetical protein HX109_02245 [Galbibacter sp. BG1]